MTFGIRVTSSSGLETVNTTLPGGRIFVGSITRAREAALTSTTYTYPKVPGGSNLRVMQVGAGAHNWSTGTDGNGNATVTMVAKGAGTRYAFQTTLYVFATSTTEPDFGVNIVNDAGERTVSSVFPCPEFLGKLPASAFALSYSYTVNNGYTLYQYEANHSLGLGRKVLVLWNLPGTSDDVWYSGSTFTGSVVFHSVIAPAGTPFALGEAFLFALDGLQASGDTFGLRVYDEAGTLCFDAGLPHMIIRGFENSLSYSLTPNTVSSFSASTFGGIQPVFLLPDFWFEVWTRLGLNSSRDEYFYGFVRRSGSTLATKVVRTEVYIEDVGSNSFTAYYGLNTNLTQIVCDGSLYGAASI